MHDLIERQAAIDELYKMLHDCFWADDEELDAVITTLNDLPSAQPEKRTEERTETHACDCIERQSAISAMEGVDWYHIDKDGQFVRGANSKDDEPLYKAKDVYAVLNQIPSAQPELPEWAQKVEEYRKSAPKTFSSPIAWALYQTWREYAERRTDDR